MSREDEIQEQFLRLADQRKALANALRQIAMQGEAFALPSVLNTRDQARKDIARIKATLQVWGISVDQHPDDLSDRVSVDWSTIPPEPPSRQPTRGSVVSEEEGSVGQPPSVPLSTHLSRPDPTPKRRARWVKVFLSGAGTVMSALLGPVGNFATAEPLPPWLGGIHEWWWVIFGVLLSLTVWMAIREVHD